jgi:hypothetical protein
MKIPYASAAFVSISGFSFPPATQTTGATTTLPTQAADPIALIFPEHLPGPHTTGAPGYGGLVAGFHLVPDAQPTVAPRHEDLVSGFHLLPITDAIDVQTTLSTAVLKPGLVSISGWAFQPIVEPTSVPTAPSGPCLQVNLTNYEWNGGFSMKVTKDNSPECFLDRNANPAWKTEAPFRTLNLTCTNTKVQATIQEFLVKGGPDEYTVKFIGEDGNSQFIEIPVSTKDKWVVEGGNTYPTYSGSVGCPSSPA